MVCARTILSMIYGAKALHRRGDDETDSLSYAGERGALQACRRARAPAGKEKESPGLEGLSGL